MEVYCEIQTEEGILRGMLNRPTQKKYPLVIMLHGFTANRNGPRFAFVRLARLLEKQGIGSMRFDFLGSGESDCNFEDMTYMEECKQVIHILEEVKKLEDVTEIYLLGHSMGGAIAGNIAALFPDLIKKCCLWAPAFCMPAIIKYLATSGMANEVEDGIYDCKGLKLSQKFVDEILNLDLLLHLEDYKNPLMIIHGTKDETVPFESSVAYLKQYNREDIEFVKIENGSHNYEVYQEINTVLENTVRFFTE